MAAPSYEPYIGVMDYSDYKHWVTQFYLNGRRWSSSIDWRAVTRSYYEKRKERDVWEQHVQNGGTHWTLFTKDKWQSAPGDTKKWKDKLQSKIRRRIREDEYQMNLRKADIESTESGSTVEEEEYWTQA